MKELCKYGHSILAVGRDRWRQCKECARKDSRNLTTIFNHDGTRFTETNYQESLIKQNNLCKICHKPDKTGRLTRDHNHLTGVFRGLLCKSCNLGIGHFQDNAVYLQSATDYLK